jgi:type III secretion protein L
MGVKVIKQPGSPGDAVGRPVTPGRSVGEDSAVVKADRIVSGAQSEVEAILAHAEAEAAALVEAATARGAQEGHASAQDLLDMAERLRAQLLASIERDALEAGVEAGKEMTLAEVKHRSTTIVDVVRRALGNSKHQREIYIRVNPRDAAVLRERKRELLDALSRARDLDIREDALVTQGGCIIETEIGVIDAQIPTQLETLADRVLGGVG